MRFTLTLQVHEKAYGRALPFSYQYELASFIYHTIARSNKEYATWLHENGFALDSGKQFKLFSFSNLQTKNIRIDKEAGRLILQDNEVELQIGFLPEKSTEEFIKGVFSNRTFTIGDRKSKVEFAIKSIEVIPQPVFNGKIVGETLSPICLSYQDEQRKIKYYAPDESRAPEAILNNLIRKYEAFHQHPYRGSTNFKWQVLSQPKNKLITIKSGMPNETKVKGYMCRFQIEADDELLKIAYNGGIGEKNSGSGFGFINPI